MHRPTASSGMEYLNPRWQETLGAMGIVTFEDWWGQSGETVESPNTKPGNPSAWGKVSTLKTPGGRTLFLKRQQNFYPNNLIQKWRKQLTYEREYWNYLKIREAAIPTYELICFHSRKVNLNRQAIYVCEGLDGFTSLAELRRIWEEKGWPPLAMRELLLDALVGAVLHMHRSGILHNALSPRHLLFNIQKDAPYDFPNKIELRLIDFERLKGLSKGSNQGIQRDLFSLNRRCVGWPDRDRIRVLKKYLGIKKLNEDAKKIVREIADRSRMLGTR